MSDVSESKELLEFIVGLAQSLGNSMEDGKIGFEDLGYLLDVLQLAGPAFEGVAKVPGEMSQLDEEGKNELVEVVDGLNIPQAEVEMVIKNGLKIALDLVEFIDKIKNK